MVEAAPVYCSDKASPRSAHISLNNTCRSGRISSWGPPSPKALAMRPPRPALAPAIGAAEDGFAMSARKSDP